MFTIAEATKKSGLAASTIRYYENEGLLNVKPFRRAGRRLFDASGVAELALLNDLRLAGMSLKDMKTFQSVRIKAGPCSELSILAAKRAKILRAEIMAMRRAEERLSSFSRSCSTVCGPSSASDCGALSQI